MKRPRLLAVLAHKASHKAPHMVLMALMVLILPALPASAQDTLLQVLVVDKDPKGTNLRDAPSGKVVRVIPFAGRNGVQLVQIRAGNGEESRGWFKVQADGVAGWMHGSVLGICADATEDGDPALIKTPDNQGLPLRRMPAGAPVGLLGSRDGWLKVRYVDPQGRAHDGWIPEHVAALSENGMEACARAWAAGK